jgi:cyclophilin family peptidyl-prolyl cis-trans isomerase
MKTLIRVLVAVAACASVSAAAANPQVELKTSMGTIVIELLPERAPRTVENFLQYVKDGFYEGTVFHRVIPRFMVQGGGFTQDLRQKPTRAPVRNEADNGLKNVTGTVAMARTPDPHSATAQFFINVADNEFLNYTAATPQGWGYTVFGRVVKGMDVVGRIAAAATGPGPAPHQDVPLKPILIERASVVAATAKPRK